jgi:hypothetical protein
MPKPGHQHSTFIWHAPRTGTYITAAPRTVPPSRLPACLPAFHVGSTSLRGAWSSPGPGFTGRPSSPVHLEHMHDAPTREIEPAPCVTQVQRTRRSGNDLGQEGVPTSTPDTTTTTTTISVRRKGRSEERCMKGQNRVNSSDRRIEFFTLPTRLFYTSSHPSHHV